MLKKFTSIPICIDPLEKQPGKHNSKRNRRKPMILFLGTMFWPPNAEGILWFARDVLPLVHKRIPDARLVIAGKSPPRKVHALAADARIEVTDYVSDSGKYVSSADVFIVPLLTGEGMRVKILDAWAWGLPIVSTSIGAEGICIEKDQNILIADSAVEFAEAVIQVLTDRLFNLRLRSAGRAWVSANYDWRVRYRLVDQVYDRLLT